MGIKVLRLKDRIKVKIEEVSFILAPLSIEQKYEISEASQTIAGDRVTNGSRSIATAFKYSVKEVEGLENMDGTPYELEFKDGQLTDDCVSDLMNIGCSGKLMLAVTNLMTGFSGKIVNSSTQEEIPGVEVISIGPTETLKKARLPFSTSGIHLFSYHVYQLCYSV